MRLRVVLTTLVLGAVALTGVVGAQTQVLFSETFAGPYQSSPNGWREVNTPVGPYWYLRDGKYTTGNGDTLTTQDKRSYSVVDDPAALEWTDYSVVVDAYMIQRNGGILLMGRWGQDDSHYEASYETSEGTVTVAISRVVGRRTEVLAQADSNRDPLLPDLANGATPADGRQFGLAFEGDRITFSIDRREVLEARDSALARGSAGVGQFENFVFFDNFRVLGIEAQPTTVTQPGVRPTPTEDVTTTVERVFRLVVAEGWTRQQARDYQRALESMEFSPVIVRENPRGGYDVLTGTFLSRQEAERQGDFLLTEGDLIDYRVVEITQGAEEELQAATEAVSAYTIRVAVFDRQAAAEATVTHLIEDLDYFPVTLFPRDNQFAILVGNFSERDEAQLLIPGLRNEGFSTAQVIETPRQELVQATAVAATEMVDQALSLMTQDERSRVEEVLEAQRMLALGGNTADQIQQLQSVLQELRQSYSGLRESVLSIQEQAREEEALRRDVSQKIQEAEDAIDQRNWGRADLIISDILSMDPQNATARLLMARVRAASSSGAEESSSSEDRIQRILEQAHEREVQGDLTGALALLTINANNFPSNDLLRAEMARIEDERDRQNQVARDESLREMQEQIARENRKQMLILAGALVAIFIVLLAAAIWWISRDKRSQPKVKPLRSKKAKAQAAAVEEEEIDEAEEEYVPEMPAAAPTLRDVTITPTGSGGIGLDPNEANQDVTALSGSVLGSISATQTKESEPEPEVTPRPLKLDGGPVGAGGGRLDLGFGEETPVPEAPTLKTPAPTAPDTGLIDLGFGDDEPEMPPVETPDPFQMGEPPAGPTLEDDTIDLGIDDDLIVTPATPDLETTQPLAMDEIDTALGLGLGAGAGTAAAGAGAAPTPSAGSGAILEQKFTGSMAGQQPTEWSGSYDFATLTVETSNVKPGSEASLCYRKQTGAGSALYTCRFPEASGVVNVEFDLCCETKNQYLLGIYFENAGNFRQSVHTVIHRSDDSVTLRLQGKAAPYEFNKWVHLKYKIDLNSGTVDGSVDGQAVAVRVPLVTMPDQETPKSIDTISIRDTLATEGVFFLDNIRISK